MDALVGVLRVGASPMIPAGKAYAAASVAAASMVEAVEAAGMAADVE